MIDHRARRMPGISAKSATPSGLVDWLGARSPITLILLATAVPATIMLVAG